MPIKSGVLTIWVSGILFALAPVIGWAQAATNIWTGGGADNSATNPANWSLGMAPLSTHHILLDATTNKNLTWNTNAADAVASWTQTAAYTGTVTFLTYFPCQGSSFTNFTILGDCVISNGVWTHAANPSSVTNINNELYRLKVAVGGDLIVGEAGSIEATGKGYAKEKGPGAGTSVTASGGSHGGAGGNGYSKLPTISPCYGSVTAPVHLGSGGWISAGGGAIMVTVAGTILNDGLIAANGLNGSSLCGAGGSVYLVSGALLGGGRISANGGLPSSHSPGGGGRVALIQTNASDFAGYTGAIQAFRGNTNLNYACSGTIYLEKKGDAPGGGALIIDNHGVAPMFRLATDLNGIEPVTYAFSRITLTNAGCLLIRTGNTVIAHNTVIESHGLESGIWLSGGTLDVQSGFSWSNCFIGVSATGSVFNPVRVGTNAVLILDAPHRITNELTVQAGGLITHSDNGAEELYRMNLTVLGDLTVMSEGRIDVMGKGYAKAQGPGSGTSASHGGQGSSALSCYGSLVAPTNLGHSGTYDPGGGAVWLTVQGLIRNDGLVCADGSGSGGRSGAGGSVLITAGQMTGNGTIRANGGGPGNPAGGGRISLVVTNAGADFTSYTGTVRCLGGGSASSSGTIYLRTAAQGANAGTLIVDNENGSYSQYTQIHSNVTDTAVGDVIVRNKGRLRFDVGQTLTVSGSWSNDATVVMNADSTVNFAGGAGSTARLYGTTAFMRLVCTNASQTLVFPAALTNSVQANGALILRGAETATNLYLRSSTPGQAWKLNVAGAALQELWHVDVQDSDARPGVEVLAMFSKDSERNTNWIFSSAMPGGTNVWTGALSALWSAGGNWSFGRIPTDDDSIRIPTGLERYPAIDGQSRTMAGLEIESGAMLSLNGFDLTVNGDTVVAGALVCAGTERLELTGGVDFSGGVFTSAFSTVVLAGTAPQTVDPEEQSFYILQAAGGTSIVLTDGLSAYELRVEAGGAETCEVAFASGKTAAVNLLTALSPPGVTNIVFRSAQEGHSWRLAVSLWHSVRGVDARDSDASTGQMIFASGSRDGGGNTNWDFAAAWAEWTGQAGNGLFGDAANWQPAAIPDEDSRVRVDTTAPMTIAEPTTVRYLTVGGGTPAASVTVNAALTVADTVTVGNHGTLLWNRPGVVSNDLDVLPGGTLSHSVNDATEVNKLDLAVGGDLVVETNAAIDVTGKGYAKTKGPGYNGAMGGSYGGLSSRGANCYGSILAPTNLGSGGMYEPGGGSVLLTVQGAIQNDGLISADGLTAPSSRSGSGGSIRLIAGALAGNGTIRANGGLYNSAGGGRIALTVTNAGADFASYAGPIQAQGPGAAGAGTIYYQAASNRPGRGVVLVADTSNVGLTDVPPSLNPDVGEARRATFRINAARLRLTNDFTMGDIWLDTANAILDLGSNTLTVNARKHELGLGTVTNWGEIIWRGLPPGVLIIVK